MFVATSISCGHEEPGGEVPEPPDAKVSPATGPVYQHPVAPGYVFGSCTHWLSHQKTAGLEEQTPLGFSASDVIARFNQRAHGTLVWADGAETRIDFTLSTTETTFDYEDNPPGEGFCAPALRLDRATLKVVTSDGLIDETFSGEQVSVFAITNGTLGIALIGLQRLETSPESIVSPLVDAAAGVHPEHDERSIVLELGVSDSGWKGSCLDGDPISDDPGGDHCNRYDGTISYESHPKDLFEDHHHIDHSMLFERPLATWMWDAASAE